MYTSIQIIRTTFSFLIETIIRLLPAVALEMSVPDPALVVVEAGILVALLQEHGGAFTLA